MLRFIRSGLVQFVFRQKEIKNLRSKVLRQYLNRQSTNFKPFCTLSLHLENIRNVSEIFPNAKREEKGGSID